MLSSAEKPHNLGRNLVAIRRMLKCNGRERSGRLALRTHATRAHKRHERRDPTRDLDELLVGDMGTGGQGPERRRGLLPGSARHAGLLE
jgi:hypothetical protein